MLIELDRKTVTVAAVTKDGKPPSRIPILAPILGVLGTLGLILIGRRKHGTRRD